MIPIKEAHANTAKRGALDTDMVLFDKSDNAAEGLGKPSSAALALPRW
jgi:hypothetical protein